MTQNNLVYWSVFCFHQWDANHTKGRDLLCLVHCLILACSTWHIEGAQEICVVK